MNFVTSFSARRIHSANTFLVFVLFSQIFGISSASAQPARAYFVDLNTNVAPAQTVSIPPPLGSAFSAAAQTNAGTIWNEFPYVTPVLNPVGNVGNPLSLSALGTYELYSAPRALVDSTGAASPVTVDVTLTFAASNNNGFANVNQSVGNPSAVMGGAWRIQRGENSLTYTVSGLPDVNAAYDLYFYGTGNAVGQGMTATLAAANVSGSNPSSASTSGTTTPMTIFDANGGLVNQGVTWNVLHGKSDASGKFIFTQAKYSSGQNFMNGFQLVRFPLANISVQPPATWTATLGSSASVPVSVTGDGLITYQWRKDGVAIDPASNPSATTAILGFATIQNADAGAYDVVVTNPGGSFTSETSVLTVTEFASPPSITSAPVDQTAVVNGAVTFKAVTNGSAPLVYTWQRSNDNATFTDIANSNSAQFSIANVQTSDAGYYRVVVTNSVSTATSSSATLTVAPVIAAPPVGGTFPIGSIANLTVGIDVGAGAPSPTTYTWKRNGVIVTNGGNVSGATSGMLQFAGLAAANSGTYTVTVSNLAGSVQSNAFYLGTPTTLTTSLWPASNAVQVNPDTPPTVKFSATPTVGTVGKIRVYDASNDALVETIDLGSLTEKAASSGNLGGLIYRYATKTIGGQPFNYFPVVVVGNEARIALRSSTTLAYGKTYYIQIDPGVLLDSAGASFPGITDKSTWRFTTKSTSPLPTAAALTVAADGSGDFTTVQGAIDLIPFSPANTTPRTISIKNGIYHEIISVRAGQDRVALQGESRTGTVIQYLNNNDILNGGHFSLRPVVRMEANDFTLRELTVRNLSTRYSGQAESIVLIGTTLRCTISRCNFYSFQDTLYLSQQTFLTDCYVEGDVDFMWGDGGAFFQRSELKMMNPGYYTQIRNSASQLGYVYVDCLFTRPSTTAVPNGTGYLGRIDVTSSGWPASMMLLVNCKMDQHVANVGWSIYNGSDFSQVRYWEYNSQNLDGTPYDSTVRSTWNHLATGAPGAAPVLDHQQVDAITAAYYSNPLNVCGFTPSVAPVIDASPAQINVATGSTASFDVNATLGYPLATYRWFKDGVAIDAVANPSAASAHLSIPNVQSPSTGLYTVVISNSAGSVTSSTAALALTGTSPIIATQPISLVTAPSTSADLTVVAGGEGPLSYQWNVDGEALLDGTAADGTVIAGSNTAALHLSNLQLSHSGDYTVSVSNKNGSTVSSAATLVVGTAPKILLQPSSQAAAAGTVAHFSVVASGATSYQWTRDGLPIAGATSATLDLTAVSSADAGNYAVTAINVAGSMPSTVVTLTITPFALPDIPATTFDVTTFGAIGDNLTDCTASIQNAINNAGNAGGGTVVVPAGVFLSGPLTLVSNVNLVLSTGSTLKMLPYGTFPGAPYTSGTTADFITANGVHDVGITGSGTIDGQGLAWWDAFEGTHGVSIVNGLKRPRAAIALTNATHVAIQNITVLNPPNTHISTRVNCRFVVISGITLTAPSDSPNTDGINLSGRDFVIDHCSVSTGDDNIVLNSSTSGGATSDIMVTHCALGTGHGLSIGSFTNGAGSGIKNLTVDQCTFNGTTSGLVLKSDTDRGGVVQNLSYSNLTMTNVATPMVIYCYYGATGSPGATGSNRITPATVAKDNATPPSPLNTATLPEWRDIAISNVTITGAVNYSIIWGLPNELVRNVTFNNINLSGGFGFEIYNAQNIQFTGSNVYSLSGSQPLFTTYNANVITGQPANQTDATGSSTSFTINAAGSSGVGSIPPTIQWNHDGAPLSNGVQSDGSVITGATTAALFLNDIKISSAGNYTATVSNSLDGYDPAAGAITLNSQPVAMTSNAATLSVTDPYLAFLENAGLRYESSGAPAADPDGDGVPNQLEYILGLDPTAPDSVGLPTGTMDSDQFVFRFSHRKSATANFAVEQSTDLTNWTPIATTTESSTATTETLVASVSLNATKQFLRLTSEGISTVPVGFLKTILPAGVTTAFGLNLDDLSAAPVGISAGKIASFDTHTLTQGAGSWTGNLANPAAPLAVRITSGNAAGALFDIVANTATSITVNGAPLSTLGIAVGDTFELVSLDTLGTFFGENTLQGGTSSANADVVQLRSGAAWVAYYYDTNLGFWRSTASAANSNDTVIRPGSALLVLRRGGTLTLTITGRVLGTAFRTAINNASSTGITTGFPLDTTVGQLGLQNLVSGWRSGTTTGTADAIGLYNGKTWIPYLFDGSHWQTTAGANADDVSLPAGVGFIIQRPGSATGTTDLIRNRPY